MKKVTGGGVIYMNEVKHQHLAVNLMNEVNQ